MDDEKPKGMTLTPVLTAILKPSADLVGERLRDYIRSGLDELERRVKSLFLEAHLARNRDQFEAAAGTATTNKRLMLLPRWLRQVEDVDPADPELAEVWDGLLRRILTDDVFSEVLLDTLKSMSAAEVGVLMLFKKRRWKFANSSTVDDLFKKLEGRGLVRGTSLLPFYVFGTFAITVGISLIESLITPNVTGPGSVVQSVGAAYSPITLIQIMLAVVILLLLPAYYLAPFMHRLYFVTQLGSQLLKTSRLKTEKSAGSEPT